MTEKKVPGEAISSTGILRFGPYQFHTRSGELTKHGSKVRLQEQPFQILLMLLARPGEIVLREEIRNKLWPNDTIAEFDHGINAAIKRLRDSLGETAGNPRYVETVARRGYRFIGELDGIPPPNAIAAEPAQATPTLGTEVTTKASPKLSRLMLTAAAGIVLFAGSFFLYRFSQRSAPEGVRIRFLIEAPEDTAFTNVYNGAAVSPDGRFIAFTATRARAPVTALWLRGTDSLVARELPGTQRVVAAFWSPDSKSIAFFAEGRLKRIEISGGPPQILCDAPGYADLDGGSWNLAGTIVFSSRGILHRVPATGGTPAVLTALNASRQETAHLSPEFLPDGRRFLFLVVSSDPNTGGLYATSLNRPQERIRIVEARAKGAYVPPRPGRPGVLLWPRGKTLVAQPFSADRLTLTGSPLPVVEDIGFSPLGMAAFWVSGTGLLVYRSGSAEKTRMSWIGRDGANLKMIGDEGVYGVPRISPDGNRVALRRRTASGNTDIWVHEFRSGVLTRLTFSPDAETFPVWSPGGRQLAFSCQGRLCRANADGTGPLEHLTDDTVPKRFLDWSRDGRYLVYSETDPHTRGDLWILPLEKNGKPSPFLRTPFDELYGQFSPEGRWIAYTSDESGREEVYVRSFPASAGKRQISNSGGTQPRWRPDGRELFYLADGKLMAVGIRMDADRIESQPPRALFPVSALGGTFHSYDVTPDGNQFLMLQPIGGSGAGALTVLSGW